MKLIAGIDPGTTVGWAVLDLHGKPIAVGSQKELSGDRLVAKLTKLGKVILVGSDRAKTPTYVQEAATKVGAKVAGPIQDIRVEEKRSMVNGLKFANAHEMDALASAIIAHKKAQPLLRKIHSFLTREKKLGMFGDVVELVLKEGVSIRVASMLLTPKKEVIKIEIEEEEKKDQDILKLYSSLSRVRKNNLLILEKNRELERKLNLSENRLSSLKKRTSQLVKPKSTGQIAKVKQKQIITLANQLSHSKQIQQKMKTEIRNLEQSLLQPGMIALPRLTHLGWDEIKRMETEIFEDAVLFVGDPNLMSSKAIEWLSAKGIRLLVCKKLPGKRAAKAIPFACVLAKEHQVLGNVVLVKKEWLETARSQRTVLVKVIEEYKKGRV